MANILSVQSFIVGVSGTATIGLATLSPSITTGTTVIFPAGFFTNQTGTGPNEWMGYLQLASTTGVSLSLAHAPTSTFGVTAYGSVVEFNSSVVNSVQYGTITLTSGETSGTATLGTSIGTNAFLIPLGYATSGSTETTWGWTLNQPSGIVTILSTSGVAGVSGTYSFLVADLTSAIVSGVQSVALTGQTLFNLTATAAISSVPTSASMLIYQGMYSTGSVSVTNIYYNAQLTSSTGVTFTHSTSAATSSGNLYATVVTLNPSMLSSNGVQRGVITLSSGTGSASIASVGTLAVPSSCRWTVNVSSGGGSNRYVALTLPTATVVSASAGYSGSVDVVSWEVIDWVAGGAANVFLTTHFPMETLEGEVLASRIWGESLSSEAGPGGLPMESTEGIGGTDHWLLDLLAKVAPTGAPPMESLGGLRESDGLPAESLEGLGGRFDGGAPLETLSKEIGLDSDPLESLGKVVESVGEPTESKGSEAMAGHTPAESLGGLAGFEHAGAESLSSIGGSDRLPMDSTGAMTYTILGAAGIPIESLATLSGGDRLPTELVAVARAIAEAPAEELAGLRAYLGLPMDAASVSTALVAYAALALESLGVVAAQAGPPVETLGTRMIQSNPSRTYYVKSTANLWSLIQVAKIMRDASFRH